MLVDNLRGLTMIRADRKRFTPEAMEVTGPGVDLWKQPERNNDTPTDHDALLADKVRRRKIAEQLSKNARDSKTKSP
jgi:hypothetical protein